MSRRHIMVEPFMNKIVEDTGVFMIWNTGVREEQKLTLKESVVGGVWRKI